LQLVKRNDDQCHCYNTPSNPQQNIEICILVFSICISILFGGLYYFYTRFHQLQRNNEEGNFDLPELQVNSESYKIKDEVEELQENESAEPSTLEWIYNRGEDVCGAGPNYIPAYCTCDKDPSTCRLRYCHGYSY